MTVSSKQITVDATPTLIHREADSFGGCRVAVKDLSNANPVFLGGADVTSSTGYKLNKDEVAQLVLGSREELWGVTEGDTDTLHVLITNE